MIHISHAPRVLALLLTFLVPVSATAAEDAATSSAANSMGFASVHGSVIDDQGSPVPGVTVAVRAPDQPNGEMTVSDSNGAFRIGPIKPGLYLVEAILDGFQPVSRPVTIGTSQSVQVALKIVPVFSAAVEVVAKGELAGEVAILETRRQAAVVSDLISAEEIRKTPDSTAAGVVERLTGVTLLGDKYVFVRGLGERYSGATINGAALATTETEKRVVPLDLFPAKLLDSVNVVKTYTPDKAGDFGSGVVEMTTTQFPPSGTLKLTLGSSYVSGTTGENFRRYAGGLTRFGGGGQPLPGSIPSSFLKRQSVLDPGGYTPAELERFGEALAGDWTGREVSSVAPSTDVALTYGNTFGRLGVVFSGTSNHGFDTVNEVQRFFGFGAGDDLVPMNDYELTLNREHATAGGVGNLSYRITDSNRVFLNTVLTRDASSEDRYQQGLQTSSGGEIRDYRVRYQIEQVLSSRLRGEHDTPGPGIGGLLEWSISQSSASNDSDLRENIYRETDSGRFELQTGLAESGKLEYFELDDSIGQQSLAFTSFHSSPDAGLSGSLKAGLERLDRKRDFSARRFRFVLSGPVAVDFSKNPEVILTPATIGPNGFELRETTGVNDAYDAGHVVEAAFVMGDVTAGRYRIITGARYERSDQQVVTFNPFDTSNEVESSNRNGNLLPSLNIVFQAATSTNLRFGYGRSVNRPEFRELSPFTFVEVSGGRSVAGNPELKQAVLDSFDMRWEMFPSPGEVIAASAFFKKIDKPIERSVQPTSDFRSSYINADSATLWGVEVEFRRSLGIVASSLRDWAVNFNAAHIKSRVTVGEQQFAVLTSRRRPLEGQSDNVANLSIQYAHPRLGTTVRGLVSYNGKRLTEVGAFNLPDVYEQAFTSVDAVISHPLGRGIDLKLAGSNLLSAEREFTQASYVQRQFQPGRKISLSIGYSPF